MNKSIYQVIEEMQDKIQKHRATVAANSTKATVRQPIDLTAESKYETRCGDKVVFFCERKGIIYGLIIDSDGEFSATWDANGNSLLTSDFSLIEKDLPPRDTLVRVWDNPDKNPLLRYVDYFNEQGRIYTYNYGATSKTSDEGSTSWDSWEVAE